VITRNLITMSVTTIEPIFPVRLGGGKVAGTGSSVVGVLLRMGRVGSSPTRTPVYVNPTGSGKGGLKVPPSGRVRLGNNALGDAT